MEKDYGVLETNFNIFAKKENFEWFVENSIKQYIKFKFGNKSNILSFIRNNFNIDIPKSYNYKKIEEILRKNGKDFYKDVLGASPLEITHLISFYKFLTDIIWVEEFPLVYKQLFNEEIKIRKRSELREYAQKMITNFRQHELIKKWLKVSEPFEHHYPVIHYEYLTLGPLGFVLTPYYREKEFFGYQKPVLSILVKTTTTGQYIIDWERTDVLKLFSTIQKELYSKIAKVISIYPPYGKYLSEIKLDYKLFYEKWKRTSHELVRNFKKQIKNNETPLWFYRLVQFTTMFFEDEEVIKMLNKLIADETLVINISEIEFKNLKITKDAIIKKPESWVAKPLFELAKDIISIESKEEGKREEKLRKLLVEILKVGTIKYLEQIFDNNPKTFKAICIKKGLHKFASLESYLIPKEQAIKLLLECYGLSIPSRLSFDIRNEINQFQIELKDFKENYKDLIDTSLVERLSTLLHKGRRYLERILKEMLFVIVSLVIHCEEKIAAKTFQDIFYLTAPIFPIFLDKEDVLRKTREKYVALFQKLREKFNISEELQRKLKYYEKRRVTFTLGDWYSLIKLTIKYINQENNLAKFFWSSLPNNFSKNINELILKLDEYFYKQRALKWLNIASHETAMIELRRSSESRKEAINVTLKLDDIVSMLLQNLPKLVAITEEVAEIKTGSRYYEAEYLSNGETKTLKIYGIEYLNTSFLYYLISRFIEGNIEIYPILITDLTDAIF